MLLRATPAFRRRRPGRSPVPRRSGRARWRADGVAAAWFGALTAVARLLPRDAQAAAWAEALTRGDYDALLRHLNWNAPIAQLAVGAGG